MDLSLLRHQSDSRYCFSIDERHALIRLAISKMCHVEEVEVIYGDPISFNKKHESLPLTLRYSDFAFNYYETIIETYPMRLMYVFHFKEEGKGYYYADSGVFEEYIFDLAFISAFQFIGENINDIVIDNPSWKGRVIYQIFPERFFKSDKLDKSYVNTNWDSDQLAYTPGAFLGGDLYGVIEKLDYLKDLGVGAIYLTPIHPSPSNHKYDVIDYYDVDSSFGGKEAFKILVDKAHQLDIKIMMDLVFNHCSNQNPIFLDVLKKGRESKYYQWFFINGDKPSSSPLNYLCFASVRNMPKLNSNNKEVQDYLIDVAKYWLKEFDIDGYRLDVSEGVSHDFWMRFKIALKDIKKDILIIGENWVNSESYLGNNQFDGVMNYPFLNVVSSYICKNKTAKESVLGFNWLLMRYKDGHNRMMMNIISSHDIQRFFNLCKGNKNLSLIGYGIMLFYLGYPLLYYGEEVFMYGEKDPDNRRGMLWDEKAFIAKEHQLFKKLIHLRKDEILIDGDIDIYEDKGLLVIKRMKNNRSLLFISNLTDTGVPVKGNIILSNKYVNNILLPEGFIIISQE